ncbi:relaxase/mobilization nuclease domain-containing protein [Algibacter pectinivorans]|uniref:Relaxase/Mobilisation nuclease domain-containing protein n=1 Tax=Algibacter pectinivorans TaxID=870482 RepID=A0A1I1RLI5_9FLAO|nr:relaxase/mobilization nuclease domain-containing protein [Algibacter pectinivorans]SFD35206.1 Relaxase/Mobilisation nuclease domain-containing protein [Algibacter pectinivorans]
MISKAKSCPGGTALFHYVVNEEKGYELLRNGLSGVTPKELYSDMAIMQNQNLKCKNNTISIVLSPTIEDSSRMSNDQLKELTKGFLKEMNLDPKLNQFIAFVHTEKDHKHLHILLNRVKSDGKLINDSFISKKAQEAAHKMASEYGWSSAKDIKETKERERKESTKEVRSIIKKAHYLVLKAKPKNLITYQKEMAKYGIQVLPTINKQGNIQGYRFIHDASGTNLKASEVDRNLKLNKLFSSENEITRNSNNLNKEYVINDYSLNTSVLKSIINQLAFIGGESQDENLRQKKSRKRKSLRR